MSYNKPTDKLKKPIDKLFAKRVYEPISEEQVKKAYFLWCRRNNLFDKIDCGAQLKMTRKALNLSAETVARRLNISRYAYVKYEESESKGTLNLGNLKKAAEALECELICVVRPVSQKPCSEIIWEKILPTALKHPWLSKCDPNQKAAALCYVAGKLLNDAKFRKLQGWTQRKS